MADLNDINAAQSVKIIGSDSLGIESTPVQSTDDGRLNVVDVLDGLGVQGALTIGTSATEAKVGGSPLSNRKLLTVYNNSDSIVYWGYTSGVTTTNGTPILKKQLARWDISPNATVYLIADTSGNNVRITEGA